MEIYQYRSCYTSMLNFFIIKSNGTIGKCTVALNNKNNIAFITGKLNIDKNKFNIDQFSKDELMFFKIMI